MGVWRRCLRSSLESLPCGLCLGAPSAPARAGGTCRGGGRCVAAAGGLPPARTLCIFCPDQQHVGSGALVATPCIGL
eukprot:1692875-Alexandrium_andersonii.AAC.1